MSGRQWFAVRCKPRGEFRAAQQFEQQGFGVYLPTELKLIRHARNMEKAARPFFPGYLFLHLASSERRWTAIRSTPGAVGAVRFGTNYPPVPDTFIDMLRAREDEAGFVDASDESVSPFKKGERIRVRDGAFSGVQGIFLGCSGEQRAMVLLEMLQRSVRTAVPLVSLSPA